MFAVFPREQSVKNILSGRQLLGFRTLWALGGPKVQEEVAWHSGLARDVSPGTKAASTFPVSLEASPAWSQQLFHTFSTFRRTLAPSPPGPLPTTRSYPCSRVGTTLPPTPSPIKQELPLRPISAGLNFPRLQIHLPPAFPELTPPSWISKPSRPW